MRAIFNYILAFSYLFGWGHAFDNPNMRSLFTLIGCDAYDLDSMLAEAKDMIANAQTKIDDIVGALVITPLTLDGRAADNARNIWNSQFGWRGTLKDPSKGDLAIVKGTYATLLDQLTTGVGGPDHSYFICTDDSLRYTRDLNDLGPNVGNSPNTGAQALYGNGVWYYPSLKDDDGVVKVILTGVTSTRPCLAPDPANPNSDLQLLGRTFSRDQNAKKLLFCPYAFGTNYRTSLAPYRDQDLGKTANLDAYWSRPGIFMHEMLHWIYGPQSRFLDKQMVVDGKTVSAYGFANCFELARDGTNNQLTNPDSYRIFAEANYISKTRWNAAVPKPLAKL